MMSLPPILQINALVIACGMFLLWGVSLLRKDASIIDPFWGLSFVLIAWVSLVAGSHGSSRALLTAVLVTVWGLRLSGYLAWRNWGKPEDYRYAAMRAHHGRRFPLVSLLTVFLLQGVLLWLIALPIQAGSALGAAPLLPVGIGLGCFALGLLFESLGDYQLARFKADPSNRGQVMDRGLWRFTRHPNYFGDFLVWWGLYLLAAESGSWWWTLLGPVLMSLLLMRVSGVPLLENSLRSRVAGYQQYVDRTSPFFPWPPRRSPHAD
jgi:steroid 5-alpha reductase family enzyme